VIKQIDDLLWQWAAWVDRRENNGLGYKMSSLNGQMAAAATLHPEARPAGLDGRVEELMSLVDLLLCRKVKPDSKAVIDRYYRSQVGGVVAVATLQRRRSDSHTAQYASEAGVNRSTIQRWVHNAQVELQLALESCRTGIRQVGVFGVVADLEKNIHAAND
jgi:transposase-like protein